MLKQRKKNVGSKKSDFHLSQISSSLTQNIILVHLYIVFTKTAKVIKRWIRHMNLKNPAKN